jgi:hypothetical protein
VRLAEAIGAGLVVAAVLVAVYLFRAYPAVVLGGAGFLVAFAAVVSTGRTRARYGRRKAGVRIWTR